MLYNHPTPTPTPPRPPRPSFLDVKKNGNRVAPNVARSVVVPLKPNLDTTKHRIGLTNKTCVSRSLSSEMHYVQSQTPFCQNFPFTTSCECHYQILAQWNEHVVCQRRSLLERPSIRRRMNMSANTVTRLPEKRTSSYCRN